MTSEKEIYEQVKAAYQQAYCRTGDEKVKIWIIKRCAYLEKKYGTD